MNDAPRFNIKIPKPKQAPKKETNDARASTAGKIIKNKPDIIKETIPIPNPKITIKTYAGQAGKMLIDFPSQVTYQSNLKLLVVRDRLIVEISSNSGINCASLDMKEARVLYKALKQFIRETT
jgi:hypothetical protein